MLHHILLFGLLMACIATAPALALEQDHRGIRLVAFEPDGQVRDIARTAPETALKRLARAYDTLIEQSPASATTIRRLRGRGTVYLIYYPVALRSRQSLNSETVALYLPNFLRKRGKSVSASPEFIVVVNHIGIRWDTRELAGLVAHELIGHGTQHLQGRLSGGRPLDLECEASLHEERAYQDMRISKASRSMVAFRKRLENHFCADFRTYMRRFGPQSLQLWAARNPDVTALLREFERYRRAQLRKRKRNLVSHHSR